MLHIKENRTFEHPKQPFRSAYAFKFIMLYMKRMHLIALALAFGLCLSTTAQKKKITTAAVTSRPALSAEQLIHNYRFNEAAHLLQKEIETARSSARSTIRLEQDLKRANMGFDMLRGTERVTFIDSIKVARTQVLNHLRLSSGAGRIVNTSDVANQFKTPLTQAGQTAYINEMADRIILSADDSTHTPKLHVAYRQGDNWSTPTPLQGLGGSIESQDFPFMMPDGVTLYYAAQGEESLGGYDLFVTRYNADTKQFLKAENLGMPFNSPANDYMLAIDEQNQLGWLVTDRNQPADTVCIYVFIPNSTRDVYDVSNSTKQQMLNAARLHSIANTQTDAEAVASARQRLAAVIHQSGQQGTTRHRRYIINDNTVYTQLNQFKSDAARRIADQADQVADQISALQQEQTRLLRQRSTQHSPLSQTNERLQQIKQQLLQLQQEYHTLCKNMRKAEK